MGHIILQLMILSIFSWSQWLSVPVDMPSAQGESEHACVVLVIDNSGSMKSNDPSFLRNTGARLLIALLDEGDSIGVIEFSDRPTRLTPHILQINSQADKKQLLDQLENHPPDGATDLLRAISDAADLFNESKCSNRYIILLSDGQPELPGGVPAGYTDQAMDTVRKANAQIIAIALTTAAESEFMFRLSNCSDPPGAVIPAHSASDLLDAYLQAIARLKDRTVIGSGSNSAPDAISFPIEPGFAQYIQQITFVLSKPAEVSAELSDPDQRALSPSDPRTVFSVTGDPQFMIYTLNSPPPGQWHIAFTGQGNVQARAILRSRLRIRILQPPTFWPLNEPMLLTASIVEEGPTGELATLIGEGSLSAEVLRPDGSRDLIDRLYDDGSHGDLRASDGIFTNRYPKTDLAGRYEIQVRGYKGVVPLAQTAFSQIVLFPQIVIDQPNAVLLQIRGKPVPIEAHLEGGSPPQFDQGTLAARITRPDGKYKTISLAQTAGIFTGQFSPEQDGVYQIEVYAEETRYKGIPYSTRALRKIQIQRIPSITISPDHLELGQIQAQELTDGITRSLEVTSTSAHPETLTLQAAGLAEGLKVTVLPAQIKQGSSAIFITISGQLTPGKYHGTLLLSSAEGIDLPVREIPISFEVSSPDVVPTEKPLVTTLKRLAVPIAGTFMVLLAGLITLRSYLLARPHPWGVLQPVTSDSRFPTGIHLAAARRNRYAARVTIGSNARSDIRINGEKMTPHHAVIKAVRISVVEKTGRPPRFIPIQKLVNVIENTGPGAVVVDHQNVAFGQQSLPLRPGIHIRIGNDEFVYRD